MIVRRSEERADPSKGCNDAEIANGLQFSLQNGAKPARLQSKQGKLKIKRRSTRNTTAHCPPDGRLTHPGSRARLLLLLQQSLGRPGAFYRFLVAGSNREAPH